MAGESAREVARRRREKGERLVRQADLFELGAAGEERTAEVLDQLPAGWTRLHDLRWPGRRFANIDHIVVGPGGVFVIDSKNWSGTVKVRDDVLRQNGYRREREVASSADAALAISELLPPPFNQVVRPVVCLVRDERVSGWARDVMVCSSATLGELLLSRPPLLDPSQASEAALLLDAQLRSATAPVETASVRQGRSLNQTARVRPGRPARKSRKRSRRGASGDLIKLAALLLIVALLANDGMQLVSGLAERFAEPFVSAVTD